MPESPTINTVIIGAAGYSGAELISILLGHPRAKIAGLYASARREKGDQPGRIDELFPRFRGRLAMEVKPADIDAIAALKPHAVFLATPHEASVELAPKAAGTGHRGAGPLGGVPHAGSRGVSEALRLRAP
jgi:N-acetyl-gamma-glutamyl-phosphate reductase